MLVLSRRVGQDIYIGDEIQLRIVQLHRNRVRIGITAPAHIPIRRDHVAEERREAVSPSSDCVASQESV